MNREIKFRVWNKVTQRMQSWEDLLQLDMTNIFKHLKRYDIRLMQYTGLKDKNGVEIYEDDIVKTKYYIGRVEYMKGSFYATLDDVSSNVSWRESEVIGNIYENPELMEKKAKREIKTTGYTIIKKPTDVWCLCPYCEMENEYGFNITWGYDDYDVQEGTANIEVQCKHCEEVFILEGDVDIV